MSDSLGGGGGGTGGMLTRGRHQRVARPLVWTFYKVRYKASMCGGRDSYVIQDLMGCCLDRMAIPPSPYSPRPHSLINHNHGLIKYIDTKAKCRYPKIIDL
jgi:hypothetical protein